MTSDSKAPQRPANPPVGGMTYARTLKDQQTYHAVLNAVVDIPAGTRVEVKAVTADTFYGLYTEGIAECIVQGPVDDFEACEPETPEAYRARGIAAVEYLQGVTGVENEDAGAEWHALTDTERKYAIGAAARMRFRRARLGLDADGDHEQGAQ